MSIKQKYEEPRKKREVKAAEKAEEKEQKTTAVRSSTSKWEQVYANSASTITALLQQQTSKLENKKPSKKGKGKGNDKGKKNFKK